MAEDRLKDRADAARADLTEHLEVSTPDLGAIRRRRETSRRRLVATAAAVAVVAGVVIAGTRPEPGETLTAGPEVSGGVAGDILAPGQTRRLPRSPLSGRSTMASVWTGTEMLIWGGDGDRQHNDGAAYDPRRNSWRRLPDSPLTPRNAPAAVWTGKEMLLWGGHSKNAGHADGAAFDPAAGTWRRIAEAPVRSAGRPVGLWTGTEMLVVAGFNGNDAISYNPASNTWRQLPDLPGQFTAPEPSVVWTGTHLVAVLTAGMGSFQTGIFRMDPAGTTWTELPRLSGQGMIRLVWTGDRLVAVVGRVVAQLESDGMSWTGLVQLPDNVMPKVDFASAWTGSELILSHTSDEALVINPSLRTWRTTPAGGLKLREQPAAVWADGVLIVWGGFRGGADGVMLRPSSLPGEEAPPPALLAPPTPAPDRVAVAGPGNVTGIMDRNGPLVVWNGRTLPVRRVEDESGNLIGYFGCRFFGRAEVERDDFDADAACLTGQTTTGTP